ncbi:MAG: helix-turn-helix domain-containing protein [Bacteroidales bacterium]|nr:helix-turn-helix domain-containing protein [Bacteroidales bacterium]
MAEKELMEQLLNQEERLKNIEDLLTVSKNVLNLDETSKLTGLSKSHLYKLTCRQGIPFYKQSKHLFFDRTEIENWLKTDRHITIAELENQAVKYLTLKRK